MSKNQLDQKVEVIKHEATPSKSPPISTLPSEALVACLLSELLSFQVFMYKVDRIPTSKEWCMAYTRNFVYTADQVNGSSPLLSDESSNFSENPQDILDPDLEPGHSEARAAFWANTLSL
ncbi:Ubiquinol-Cytochrome-C Reductase Complex Assembly Factor 1 [Manis pentadactyla]|nr:Ubiquinol-Cytochrome-C Reductase Complex Assembly Factor 1 [Manis pentadactyla]